MLAEKNNSNYQEVFNLKLPSTTGDNVSIADFKGKKNLVIYIYPQDNTPGCTRESVDFTDNYHYFNRLNTEVIGISKNSIKSHMAFKEKYNFPFQLLSDEDLIFIKALDCWKEKTNYGKKSFSTERTTLLIDKSGNLVKCWRKVTVLGHVMDVLNEVKNLVFFQKDFSAFISNVEEVVDDLKNGKGCILIDDEGRENEGDIVFPASNITSEKISFMLKNSRGGMLCTAIPHERAEELELPLLERRYVSENQANFLLPVEARSGITTGISAEDRARTIQVLADPSKGKDDIATPGHIPVLKAVKGGIENRRGHTEASLELVELSGFVKVSVIAEVLNDDATSTVADLESLVRLSIMQDLKILTVDALAKFLKKNKQK